MIEKNMINGVLIDLSYKEDYYLFDDEDEEPEDMFQEEMPDDKDE